MNVVSQYFKTFGGSGSDLPWVADLNGPNYRIERTDIIRH